MYLLLFIIIPISFLFISRMKCKWSATNIPYISELMQWLCISIFIHELISKCSLHAQSISVDIASCVYCTVLVRETCYWFGDDVRRTYTRIVCSPCIMWHRLLAFINIADSIRFILIVLIFCTRFYFLNVVGRRDTNPSGALLSHSPTLVVRQLWFHTELDWLTGICRKSFFICSSARHCSTDKDVVDVFTWFWRAAF